MREWENPKCRLFFIHQKVESPTEKYRIDTALKTSPETGRSSEGNSPSILPLPLLVSSRILLFDSDSQLWNPSKPPFRLPFQVAICVFDYFWHCCFMRHHARWWDFTLSSGENNSILHANSSNSWVFVFCHWRPPTEYLFGLRQLPG